MTSLQNSNCFMSEAEGHLLPAQKDSSSLSRKGRKRGDSPPLDVIVFQRGEPSSWDSFLPSPRIQKSPMRWSSLESTPSPSSFEISTSTFHLMPRNSLKSTSCQGRKRSSASISPGIFSTEDSVNCMITTRAFDSTRFIRGPPLQDCHCLESPGGVGSTLSNLNALSLQTPENARASPLNSNALGCPSPPTFLDDGLALNLMLARTSFTRYTGSPAVESSPTSPLDSATRLRTPMTMGSPAGSAFSSPKTASLTVLSHDGRNYPTPTSFGQTFFSHAKTCSSSGVSGGGRILLPQRNWRGSGRSIDSFSTINGKCTDKLLHRSGKTNASSGCTSKKSVSGRIPFPQVALTPRTSGTHRSCLTRFPSPPRNDEMNCSFFSFESGRRFSQTKHLTDEECFQQEPRPHSFTQETACSTLEGDHDIISFASFSNIPDVSRGMRRESSVEDSPDRCCKSGSQLPSKLRPRSRSLLKRSGSQNSILAELYCSDDVDESLSLSEEEGAFFLVPPSSLGCSKLEKDVPHKKMRSHQVDELASTNANNLDERGRYLDPKRESDQIMANLNQLPSIEGNSKHEQLSHTWSSQKSAVCNVNEPLVSRDLFTPPMMRTTSSSPHTSSRQF